MENNLLFITVEDVKKSPLWQPINDRKQSTYNDNLIYNSILKTSLWIDRLAGATVSEKINKQDLFPWVKKDGTGLIDYNRWLNYIQSACLLAVINWYLPKGVDDLRGSASISQGGVAYSQTNDPEANENITKDVKNALKLAGEIIDTTSAKTFTRPYNYVLDNYAHPWEEKYKHISKKTFYPTLLFWLKNRLFSDNSINISYSTKNDFSKIDYNEYIKLVVPFDNNTIYYDNGLWKAKLGNIPDNVITDEMFNKDYIDKSDSKYIVKNALLTVNNETKNINDFILDLQNKIISLNQEINNMKWEVVDTSDFAPDIRGTYQIKNFDKINYEYRVFVSLTGPYNSRLGSVASYKNFKGIISNVSIELLPKPSYIALLLNYKGKVYNQNQDGIPQNLHSIHVERKKVS
ncbi:hypothetical protein P344_03470 [Spiroplasma mirum ATCC 29335]|uniref:Uncharacterized protein n=1 Tax=Spiroplasma mirum ATCC 29335 TaxID=838561 RepID=W0GLF9_9MOLU|nr:MULTISPECIES: hypothetical protein [Spiroplasma]AHF61012.1 hypothetical protein SMM_0587 [Spiroplasma mirum ATCC 29335]AHI58036.1 hypothetical protein P344_03470 [Spiroplasma mirum ATCC 29335]AKM53115.1 hypothetical protein SATRI_v1c06430 [Spiroplasma atrichopogonis]